MVFTASLGHLSSTPRLYGWTFDFKSETTDIQHCDGTDLGVSHTSGRRVAGGRVLREHAVRRPPDHRLGLVPVKGALGPAIVAGRAPQTPNEVALGAATMHALRQTHRRHGADHGTEGPARRRTDRRPGRVPASSAMRNPSPTARGSRAPVGTRPARPTISSAAFSSARTRRTPTAPRSRARSRRSNGTNPVGNPIVPTEIDRLRKINWFPTATAALLALLALVAVAHAVTTSTRRRRRDLAVLKTIGFGRAASAPHRGMAGDRARDRRVDRRHSARRARRRPRSGARSHTASACASSSRCPSDSCSSCPPSSSRST